MKSFKRTPEHRIWLNIKATMMLGLASAITITVLPSQAAEEEQLELEEVLVTATRRAETDIQRTPVAVTPISEAQIDRVIPRDLGDLLSYAPNVIDGKQPGFNSANFAIRGVGQNGIILYFENQVGVTVDDFVIPHIQTANIEMLDIQSVEILRGPQGTLFGKNTTGGVINVKTNRPELQENSFSLQGQVASFDTFELKGVGNLALGAKAALRLAAMYRESEGFYEKGAEYGPVTPLIATHPHAGDSGKGDGSNVGGDDLISGRFKLRWQPTDSLDINLAYEVVRDGGDSPPSVNGTPDGDYIWNLLGFTRDSGDPIKNAATTNRNDALLGMGTRGHEIDVDGYYLNVDWTLSDSYTLLGFVGRRETDSWLPSTYTGEVGPVSLFDANRQDERETTQFEVRLASSLSGSFNWVGGVFYQKDETVFTVAQLLGFVDMTVDANSLFGDPLFFNKNPQVLSNAQDAKSWALYADGSFNITDRWSVGAGIRYTHEEKSWIGRQQVFVQALSGTFDPDLTWRELGEPLAAADFSRYPAGVVRDNEEWDEPTWRLTTGYQVNDDLFTYFTYSHGFKSGGYNDQTGTGGNPIEPIQARPVEPEIADSFEIGMRSEWLNNRLRLNLTGFYVTYDDSQQQLLARIGVDRDNDGVDEASFQETRFFNAAEVKVYGAELEATWLATDNFTIQGSLGLLDSEFDTFEADTNFDGTIDTNLSNNDVARAPELTWNVDFLYNHNLMDGMVNYVLNVNYVDEAVYAYTAVPDTPDGLTDDRTLVNASITYRTSSRWIRAFGKNLTDEEYRIGELPVANFWVMSFYGAPRMFGIEFGTDIN